VFKVYTINLCKCSIASNNSICHVTRCFLISNSAAWIVVLFLVKKEDKIHLHNSECVSLSILACCKITYSLELAFLVQSLGHLLNESFLHVHLLTGHQWYSWIHVQWLRWTAIYPWRFSSSVFTIQSPIGPSHLSNFQPKISPENFCALKGSSAVTLKWIIRYMSLLY